MSVSSENRNPYIQVDIMTYIYICGIIYIYIYVSTRYKYKTMLGQIDITDMIAGRHDSFHMRYL